MGQRCQVCQHPERARAEMMLSRGVSGGAVAKKFGIGRDAVYRHRKNHMSDQLKASLKMAGVADGVDLAALRDKEGEGLIGHLVAQRQRLWFLLALAEEAEDFSAATRAHSALTANLQLTGKIVGELASVNVRIAHNLVIDPQYITLRSGLLRALRDFPQARRAVAAVLKDLEGSAPHIDGVVMPIEQRKMIEAQDAQQ